MAFVDVDAHASIVAPETSAASGGVLNPKERINIRPGG
jgi:hypothetical protein